MNLSKMGTPSPNEWGTPTSVVTMKGERFKGGGIPIPTKKTKGGPIKSLNS